jgi:Pyruvate/2-oxoacid:ferredoxin oxidoreductase gamma subunit
VAEREVLSPSAPAPHLLVAFNAPSLQKFAPRVTGGGAVVYDCSVIREAPQTDPGIRVLGVPCSEIAQELGKLMVKNIVALGALQAASGLFPPATFLAAIRQALKDKPSLASLNEQAFARGREAALRRAA